jgi:2-oxoglutarate decarboxylase
MGESVTEGTVVGWRKREGDPVTEGEVVADVTTDKVDVEVPAPVSGVLRRIIVGAGESAAVGAAIAEIEVGAKATAAPTSAPATRVSAEGDGAAAAEPAAAPAAPASTDSTAGQPAVAERPAAAEQPAAKVQPAAPPTAAPQPAPPVVDHPEVAASPLARRAAALAGVDLSTVHGSGPGGLIRGGDVAAAANGPAPSAVGPVAKAVGAPSPSSGPPPEGATQLRGPAAALAAYMEQSREIPTATSFRSLEVDALEARRRELNAAITAAGRPEKVSFTHLIGYAIVRATLDVPSMTGHFERHGETPLRVQPGTHLGLAVDVTRKDGSRSLVVPVIRDATDRDFASFRDEYERLVAKARTNTLTVDELRGASITLTNPGGIGTVASVPRLMPLQGTIIATGSIDFPAGVRNVGEARLRDLGVTKVMTMTSTYDHRVIQGAESGEFLRRIEELLNGADGFYTAVFRSLGLPAPASQPPMPELSAEAAARVQQVGGDGRLSNEILSAVSAGMSLVKAHRTHGHLGARLDPLGTDPLGDPSMDPATVGLTPALMAAVPAAVLRTYVRGATLADILPKLRETYCGTIAYEIEHISSHEQRVWLREHIESGAHRMPLSPERKLQLLQRLTKVDAMERYLRRTFIGQKTFSIEGLDAMVPMLEELLTMVADDGIGQVVMGMAHRGRLATIAHVVNRPYESILVAFEQGEQRRRVGESPTDPTGDVKYHLGAIGTYLTESARAITVRLLPNPSHLEAVDPVVEGWTRAEQTRRSASTLHVDPTAALPLLIHGDAAFPAQGVVAEVLNLQSLQGYGTGGTVHVIANNQVGFTTDPSEARSTRYASDLAKGFDIPIIHINADDLEASIQGMRLAYEFRRTFHRDVVLDLIGYRRFGHNETDEPAYTQPKMYDRIRTHATVREIFAQQLIDEGLITKDDAEARAQAAYDRVQGAHHKVKATTATVVSDDGAEPQQSNGSQERDIHTGVPVAELLGLNEQLLSFPERFTVNPKLVKQIERRRAEVRDEHIVDWPTAESLAFASLLLQGRPIRLTGQDTERGTFSQRHLVFHDVRTGGEWTPMQQLVGATSTFELHNSPLSEEGTLGFEYGYSASAPDTLVLWEAQFGDFVNGAQVIVDQFISSGYAKWGQQSRLTLLLPHGYEGQGPDHSSARLERFLQLAVNGNIGVANCSTAAQYFHLLRLQSLSPRPRPLVVMTPKSLLRSREAASPLDQLARGRFMPVIDDPLMAERHAEVRTLLLCTGKIYWDMALSPLRANAQRTAIARVEMLDPLPVAEILALIGSYPELEQLMWVQEEPRNKGAWLHIARPIGRNRPYDIRWDYIGRPPRASASEGYHGAHLLEQERIITDALTVEQTPSEQALALARSGSSS